MLNYPHPMPANPVDCVGLILKLKSGVADYTIDNFGYGRFVFAISENKELLSKEPDKKKLVRLFPEEEYPHGRVHGLATVIGYDTLTEIFEVVGKHSAHWPLDKAAPSMLPNECWYCGTWYIHDNCTCPKCEKHADEEADYIAPSIREDSLNHDR